MLIKYQKKGRGAQRPRPQQIILPRYFSNQLDYYSLNSLQFVIIQIVNYMGNQPNNFIQCGADNKDTRQQTMSTRQQAIKQSKGNPIFNPDIVESKVGTVKLITESSNPETMQSSHRQLFSKKNNIKPVNGFIPEHENILRLSKTPKNKYFVVEGGQYFEEERGKCLDEIIESRYNTTMHFPEYQIISLLECLVYSLAYMSKKNINYHDFYPTNIFYSNGNFKMLNPLLAKMSGYSMTQQRKRFSFLSPQLILQVLNDTPVENISQQIMDKSDVFAIGMILLQFCTLTPSSECYDPETYSIVDQIINERVQKTRQLYNPLIADCIDLMLQYEVDKRIPLLQLVYSIHSHISQIRDAEINQMSRIQQMSRMTFSQAPQLPNQPRIVLPPPHPGMILDPKIMQGSPPGLFNHEVSNANSGMQSIPYKVSVNPPPNAPHINGNLNPYPSYNSNYSMPNLPKTGLVSNFTTTPPPPFATLSNLQKAQKFGPLAEQSSFTELKKISQSQNIPSYIKSPEIISDKSATPPTFLASESSNFSKNVNSVSSTSGSLGLSKQKLNPFQEIQQQLKEQQEESPQKNQPSFGISNKNQASSYYQSFSTSSNNNNYSTNIYKDTQQKTRQQKKIEGDKYDGYTFKSTPFTSAYSGSYTSEASSISAQIKAKQESLDERVRKILQASKNIK